MRSADKLALKFIKSLLISTYTGLSLIFQGGNLETSGQLGATDYNLGQNSLGKMLHSPLRAENYPAFYFQWHPNTDKEERNWVVNVKM